MYNLLCWIAFVVIVAMTLFVFVSPEFGSAYALKPR